jgi:hypothetical protein
MVIPINSPNLAGGIEWLVGDSRPLDGVELTVGPATGGDEAVDVSGFLTPAQAELLALALLVAARRVRTEQDRRAGGIRRG